MRLVVISGRSGSGKSSALHALEDRGFYCIDNLPLTLLNQLPDELIQVFNASPNVAVSVDIRNLPGSLHLFSNTLKKIRKKNIECTVVFLDASQDCLIKRYNMTRRKHPLISDNNSLIEAIKLESRLLDPIFSETDIRLDTTYMSVHEVREEVCKVVLIDKVHEITFLFQSFGFKHGVPKDGDFVFDVRCLPNPYWNESIRKYTGLDKPIIEFLQKEPSVEKMVKDIQSFVYSWMPEFISTQRHYLTIAIGCTGGHHRSVYICEQLFSWFSDHLDQVQVRHRDL